MPSKKFHLSLAKDGTCSAYRSSDLSVRHSDMQISDKSQFTVHKETKKINDPLH